MLRSTRPHVTPLEPARWEGREIRRFHVDGRPTWLFADVWPALGMPRPRALEAIEALVLNRHKWHVDVDGLTSQKWIALARDGEHEPGNVFPLCAPCNLTAGTRSRWPRRRHPWMPERS